MSKTSMMLARLLSSLFGQAGTPRPGAAGPATAGGRERSSLEPSSLASGEAPPAHNTHGDLAGGRPSGDAATQRRLGREMAEAGRLDEARAAFEYALSLAPDDPEALSDLGNVARLAGRLQESEALYRSALRREPGNAAVRTNLALLEQATGRSEAALVDLELALGPPAFPLAVSAASEMLLGLSRHEEAARICNRVLLHEPGHPSGHKMLRQLMMRSSLPPAEAGELVARALASGARNEEVLLNRALCAEYAGRLDDALTYYDECIERFPGAARVRFHRALALLASGDFARGWDDYELRLRSEDLPAPPLERPIWTGAPLDRGTVLVYGEQGIGDEIMFASCLTDALAVCPQLVYACAPKLEAIFRRSFPRARILALDRLRSGAAASELADVAAMTPVGSLPRLFRRDASRFPRHGGYLEAAPEQVREYRQRLDALGPGLKVGFSWRGGSAQSRRSSRTLDAAAIARVLDTPGVRFVDMQYDSDGSEPALAAAMRSGRLIHWDDALTDYDRTAALAASVDVIVSVCTALVHLAGALGRPVLCMTPFVAEWRYGTGGSSMPWYPSVRLMRQGMPGSWNDVARATSEELQAIAAMPARP
jgi:tetratricopeptide (TPR) repeat protein